MNFKLPSACDCPPNYSIHDLVTERDNEDS